MQRSKLLMTVKTPHRTLHPKDSISAYAKFNEEIEKKAVNVVTKSLAARTGTAINRAYIIIATFFQRVCSRTPLDEDYSYVLNGEIVNHIADEKQCRMDWYIECDGKRLTAKDIAGYYPNVFDDYNDSESIDNIKNLLKNFFDDVFSLDVVIGNSSEYFATLEYGGYDPKTTHTPNQGEKYKHGVANGHSIQAPVGMLRITEMEFESMANSPAVTSLSKRYRGQRTSKDLSDQNLKRLVRIFKGSRRIKLEDIRRYIGV